MRRAVFLHDEAKAPLDPLPLEIGEACVTVARARPHFLPGAQPQRTAKRGPGVLLDQETYLEQTPNSASDVYRWR
jgi:hypothetical protein